MGGSRICGVDLDYITKLLTFGTAARTMIMHALGAQEHHSQLPQQEQQSGKSSSMMDGGKAENVIEYTYSFACSTL